MVAQLQVIGETVLAPSRLGLWLLGAPAVRLSGRPVPLRTRKTLALLAYLAAEGGTHRRAELAALLWPESDEHRARTTLRSAVHDLRGGLRTGGGTHEEYLLVERDSLGLRAGTEVDLDLAILRSASDSARSSIGVIRPTGEERRDLIKRLQDGAEVYRGDFMHGFFLDDAPEFDYWVSLERERWRTRLAAVLDRLSSLFLEGGEVQEAAAVAERWVTHEPAGEAAHERLMRVRYAIGDPTGALRAYDQFRSTLGTDPRVGTTPAHSTAALAARIRSEGVKRGRTGRPAPGRDGPAHGATGPRAAPGAPLVGRAKEFGALAEEQSLAASGGVRVAALVGEAGIGKTRLAEEFLHWALAEGSDVLRGDGPGPNRSVPYGSVTSAIRYRLERERAPDDLLDDVWLAELGRLLPELRERYPDLPPPSPDEVTAKSRLFEAVARVLEALARRAPVTLFVDDLHWADAATLDLLRYLLTRLATEHSPLLVLVAMRAEEPDRDEDPFSWLWALERAVPVRRLELGNLDEYDSRQILLALTDEAVDNVSAPDLDAYSRRLHAETGGHPFFLVETIKALLEQENLSWSAGHAQPGLLPPSVRGLIRERLVGVGLATTDLLSAAAVLCQHIDFDPLCQVAGLDEREGLAALDEAVRRRLLREPRRWRGDGLGGYSFVHDKVREVVYADAGAARRRVFHRRALEALTARGAPASELARHALAAGASEAAVRHSLAAAEQALAVFAVEDARGYLLRAKALLEEQEARTPDRLGSADERRGLYEALGRVHEVECEWGEAQDAYEHLLAEAREAGDQETEWRTLHRLATLGVDEGSVARAERGGEFYRRLRGTGNVGTEVGDRRDGRGSGLRPAPESFAWSPATARTRETEALGIARGMDRDDLVVQSLTAVGVLEAYSGRWERALSAAEEGIAVCSRIGDKATEGELLSLVTRSLTMAGEPRAAARRMRDHPGLTGALGDREIHRADIFSMAIALTETGDYGEALAIARDGVAAARSVGYAPRLMLNLLALGDTFRTLFRVGDAGAIYREMAEVTFPPEYHALVHAKLSAVAALEDDWTTAYDEAVRAARLRDEVPIQGTAALHLHLDVEALLRGGDRDLARDQLDRFGANVDRNRRLRLAHLRALAVLRQFDGDGDGALEQLHRARTLAEEIGLPGELWQVDASIGALQAMRGQAADAERSRARAAATVGRLADAIQDPALRARFVSGAAAHRERAGAPTR